MLPHHVEIAHQSLAFFQHVVDVADGKSVFHQGVAVERPQIHEAPHQVGGFFKIGLEGAGLSLAAIELPLL